MARRAHVLSDKRVISAGSYREFLGRSFDILKSEKESFSYGYFANKAGFKSRSFIADVIKERKNLTTSSALKVAKGLDLTKKLRDLFLLLVENEGQPTPQLSLQIEKLRKSLTEDIRNRERSVPVNPSDLYSDAQNIRILLSLGEQKKGAQIEEVIKRCRLGRAHVEKALDLLIDLGVAEYRDGRYFHTSTQLDFDQLHSVENFRKLYLDANKLASLEARKDFSDKRRLFLHAAVNLNGEKLEELRNKLRSVVSEFVDQHHEDSGDHVATVLVSFF